MIMMKIKDKDEKNGEKILKQNNFHFFPVEPKTDLASSFFSSSKAAVAAAMRAKLYLSEPHPAPKEFSPWISWLVTRSPNPKTHPQLRNQGLMINSRPYLMKTQVFS